MKFLVTFVLLYDRQPVLHQLVFEAESLRVAKSTIDRLCACDAYWAQLHIPGFTDPEDEDVGGVDFNGDWCLKDSKVVSLQDLATWPVAALAPWAVMSG